MEDYNYHIDHAPDFSMLTVQIPQGKTLKVESSSMAGMDTHVVMKTRLKGGLGRFLTGENIFMNEFSAPNASGEIRISPALPGDIGYLHLNEEIYYLQNSAFLAAGKEVDISSQWQGLMKGFFSGENLFLIRASGHGPLWFNTYGAMYCVDVDGDYLVDTGYVVAFSSGLQYQVYPLGGYKSLFFSGEGLVCKFQGKGKVWIQTRKVEHFVSWLRFFQPAGSQ